ncbi:CPBP family glutamic-type intramembrane protease [Pseudarthrobacter sp.]|uniref:CPBP family glutamic-type intramembrane protease n=1 Tax=Pseudarthrobacter sp. TaxID=1934409 RepID=UPI002FCA05BC
MRLAAQRVRNHGGNNRERLVWAAFLLGAVLLLNVGNAIVYGGGDPLAALVLASVQFIITLWGYPLPRPVDWVPLLALAVTVGFFEAVFFRGFIETRLEASFGPIAGVAGAAALYAANGMAYHVGYGMGGTEMLLLFGLGIVYAVAFAVARNLVVLWPLLVPLGSFHQRRTRPAGASHGRRLPRNRPER